MQYDLEEYNARPYNRYALGAIQNLAEFSTDPAVKTAAVSVLDYMSAKYAIASSLGRRSSPYRRLVSDDGPDFFFQPDEEQCRFALYAGTADLQAMWVPPSAATFTFPDACNLVVRQAVGAYFPPPMTLELAMNKKDHPYFEAHFNGQNPFHGLSGGLEIYDNEGPFTISAGGYSLEGLTVSILGTTWGNGDDDGAALPTVLMPNVVFPPGDPRNATNRSQLLRFVSNPWGDQTNNCVAPGFACGSGPTLPDGLCGGATEYCVERYPWTFLDYSTATDGFYVALWEGVAPATWSDPGASVPVGFFEAVPASQFNFGFAAFQSYVLNNNPPGTVAQLSSAYSGRQVTMNVHYTSARLGIVDAQLVKDVGSTSGPTFTAVPTFPTTYPIESITAVEPMPPNIVLWPLASGPLASIGHSGTTSLTVSGYGTCTWDLSQAGSPSRSGACDTMPATSGGGFSGSGGGSTTGGGIGGGIGTGGSGSGTGGGGIGTGGGGIVSGGGNGKPCGGKVCAR
jgi:hypothetical protein